MFYDGEEEQPVSGLGVRAQPVPAAKAVPADSYSDLAVRIQQQSADRKAYFDKLAEQLKAKRYAPSASERLFAISAALAQPTRVPGFGGVLSNVMPVFQQFEKDKRAAEEARAADMEKLGLARLGMGDDEIRTALDLQKLRAQYLAAGQPDIQLDQQGNIREVPKTVYRPATDAEYAAIPIGAFYVVPSGPEAGKIIPKQ
jgi:hypothetical protein